MCEVLYLESAIRDKLGVSDGLIKKTRREVAKILSDCPVQEITINGRKHVAYNERMVRALIAALEGKHLRAGGVVQGCDESIHDVLGFALVQGVLCEKNGNPHSDEVTLRVRLITKNRMIMLADDPEGGDPVRLRVKNTTLFIHRMEVPGCRKIAKGVYEYAGRQPRSRGRW